MIITNTRRIPCTAAWIITLMIGSYSLAGVTHFEATLATDNLDQPVPGSTATGTASLTLNEPDAGTSAEVTLDYTIQIQGLDLDAANMDPEDVWGIHIHHSPVGSAGPHVLNVFGRPRIDDADVIVSMSTGEVSGTWDDTDENLFPLDPLQPIGPGNIHPGSSHKLSDFVDALKNNELYIAVHSWGNNGNPEIGGRILAVPEPSSMGGVLILACGCLVRCRRRKRVNRR